MDHLAARRLQDAPHDVDRRVVAVEQARRGDEADLVRRLVDQRLFGDGEVVHHCSGDRVRTSRGVSVRRACWSAARSCCRPGRRRRAYSRRPLPPTLYSVYVNVNTGAQSVRRGERRRPRGPSERPEKPRPRGRLPVDPAAAILDPRLPRSHQESPMSSLVRSAPPRPLRRGSCCCSSRPPAPRFRPASPPAPRSKASPSTTWPTACKVLLFPDASQPKVTVNITYLVGSRHGELRRDRHGAPARAHGVQGHEDARQPDGRARHSAAWRSTARPGTTAPTTSRRFRASDENLDWALGMEADRMVNSTVLRKDLDSEMTVVRNEMERNENSPVRMLIQRTTAAGFDWHNYGKDTIGARTDVERVDIGRLQAFYRLYYQPDNAVLIVAGAFDPDRALALVAKYFGPTPEAGARAARALHRRAGAGRRPRGHAAPRRQHAVAVGDVSHRSRRASGRRRDFDAAVDAMTVSPGGRLYKALVETKKAAARRRLRLHRLRPRLRDVPRAGAGERFARRRAHDDAADDRGRGEAAVHARRKSTAFGRRRSRRSTRRSTIRSDWASRFRDRSRPATGGCSSCSATAGAR